MSGSAAIDKIMLTVAAGAVCFLGYAGYNGLQTLKASNEEQRATRALMDTHAKAQGFIDAEDQSAARHKGFADVTKWNAEKVRLKAEADARSAAESTARARGRYDSSLRYSACYDAEKLIKQILKAPATAKFEDCYDVRMNKERTKVWVQGKVNAQNSFGALLVNCYVVSFDHADGGDVYRSLRNGKPVLGDC